MPRKHPRPAARKCRARMRARLEAKARREVVIRADRGGHEFMAEFFMDPLRMLVRQVYGSGQVYGSDVA